MQDLPFRDHPFITGVELLDKVEKKGEKLVKTPFTDGRVHLPFFVLFRLNEVEGEGPVSLVIYDEEGRQVFRKEFPFGEQEKYYDHVTVYQCIDQLPGNRFYLTIFLREEMMYGNWVELNGAIGQPLPASR